TLRARDIVAVHVEPLIYALVVGGIAWATASGLHSAGARFPVVAAVTTLAGTAAFLLLARTGMRRGRGDWPWLRDTLFHFLRRSKPRSEAAAAPASTTPSPLDR